MYEDITYELIMQRMLARVPNNIDKREGSIVWDALAPAAFEVQQMYIELDDILNEAFGDTASREFLIRRVAERGITPAPATKAILQAEFTPKNIDMLGKRFSLDSLNYVVIEKISNGTYKIQCETEGVDGNQYFGDLLPIDYIDGLQTAKLTDILIPAEDEEETEHLRQRYYDSFGSQAFGGNQKDYLDKTNSIEGVGATKVTPLWDGGNTIKLTILDAQYNKASDVLIAKAQQIIDPTQDGEGVGFAPIGHVVAVDTVAELPINIKTDIVFDNGYSWEAIQSQVTQSIQEYLFELRKTWANLTMLVVRIAQIEARILSAPGVLDIGNTMLNGLEDNITTSKYEIPVLGGITL